jgi:thiamine-monophosphate kinase
MKNTVAELGELRLLERIRSRLQTAPAGEVWAGDDTAVLRQEGGRLLLTTDLVMEGLDFDLSYASGADVGWKVLAANASDISSMCGVPSHAVVALAVPPECPVSFVDEFIDGLVAAAGLWQIALVGGDVSGAKEISATVSMVGRPVTAAVLRSGAQTGDAICVTGALGGAAAGLIALRRGMDANDPAVARLVERQLRPRARVREAALLASFTPNAMIDISDGLAVDLEHVLDASNAACSIDTDSIPIDPDISSVPEIDPFEAAVTGGEDFELLFTMDPERVDAAAAALSSVGTPLTKIGVVGTGERYLGPRSLEEWRERGWEHLRPR